MERPGVKMPVMTVHAPVADPVRTIVHLTNAVAASRTVQVIAELAVADAIGFDEEGGHRRARSTRRV